MPLADREQVKKILQITDSSKDSLIDALLYPVQDWIVNYCMNRFEEHKIFASSSKCIIDKEAKTITDLGSGRDFILDGFQEGMDISIEGSKLNDGIYKLTEVTANTLFLDELLAGQKMYNEGKGEFVIITPVKFPAALIPTAAKIISLEMNKRFLSGTLNESLGDYSIATGGDYPESIYRELNVFRAIY